MSETQSVRDILRNFDGKLTLSERKLTAALLSDYPAAGLASMANLATAAGVSTPSVVRWVKKLGFGGYPQFHECLRNELKAQASGPVERRARWTRDASDAHMLNRFSQSIMQNMEQTFQNIDPVRFDAAVDHLARSDSQLYIAGGRITRALADYAFTHFQAIRPNVTHLTASSATWPHYVVDMHADDTLLIFDVRRYETSLERLAELALERGVQVILITDQWASPISQLAGTSFSCWVDVPSAWDSNAATMVLLEALIAAAQEKNWQKTNERFNQLDALFDKTQLFRRGKQ